MDNDEPARTTGGESSDTPGNTIELLLRQYHPWSGRIMARQPDSTSIVRTAVRQGDTSISYGVAFVRLQGRKLDLP